MRIPAWGLYMMCAASLAGLILLGAELKRRGFPSPLSKG
jgi:hypothetical protein